MEADIKRADGRQRGGQAGGGPSDKRVSVYGARETDKHALLTAMMHASEEVRTRGRRGRTRLYMRPIRSSRAG